MHSYFTKHMEGGMLKGGGPPHGKNKAGSFSTCTTLTTIFVATRPPLTWTILLMSKTPLVYDRSQSCIVLEYFVALVLTPHPSPT